jgi:tRNA-splicing ligase RtcB (3'-phosphate/5'-hydroxy nucleic acid ligase)
MDIMWNELNQNIPIKLWDKNIETSAKAQVLNLSNLPFAYHHIAIMPDCHAGYGMPIGGILATNGVIIPNAVGVDIGCGMCAVKTSLRNEHLSKDTLKKIIGEIRKVVPVGFEHQKENQDERLLPSFHLDKEMQIISEQYQSALKQLGTLGGGNHFIEIQKDNNDNIWIMIHSGSRNLGKKVADHYNKIAVELNKKWYSSVPKKWELAFLPIESKEAKDYMAEMNYCVEFALANRKLMMEKIGYILTDVCSNLFKSSIENPLGKIFFEMEDMINIAHNYARWENHFGKNVIIHRKGATSAKEGEIGIIPGSQGTKSYIVKGKGNPDSFMSCSHGAGRIMSRMKARAELDLEREIKSLDKQGIIHSIRHQKDLDEASSAYKDINEVMENQKDLVEILVELTPLGVIKG